MQIAGFAGIRLDISDFPTRHHYGLALWQSHFERDPRGLGRRARGADPPRPRGGGPRAGRHRRRRRAVRRHDAASAVPRRVRRRAQPGPQGRPASTSPGSDPSTSWMIAEVEMDEEPELGFRRDGGGIGPSTGGRAAGRSGSCSRSSSRPHRRARRWTTSARRSSGSYGTDYGVHSPALDLPLHRHDAAGGLLPQRPGAARRRRRARAPPAGRPGPQHRRAGRREPGLEAGPGGRRDLTRGPARHLPRRTPPGRCAGAAEHDGAGRAQQPDERHQALRDTWPSCWAWTSRAAHRRDALRPRHPLRPRRRPPAARAAHARPRPARPRTARRACSRCCTTPGRCCSTSAGPAASTSPVGGSRPAGRRHARRRVGAPGPRRGRRARRPC